MNQQNRPYSIQNIFDNLRKAVKKPALQKALDELVEEKLITCKEYGKSQIFLYNQSNIEEVPDEEIKKVDQNMMETKQKIETQKGDIKQFQKSNSIEE